MVEWHTVAQDVNKRFDRGSDRQEFAHSVRPSQKQLVPIANCTQTPPPMAPEVLKVPGTAMARAALAAGPDSASWHDGITERCGTGQGSVISPLLGNI
jgi:hypothetical protein